MRTATVKISEIKPNADNPRIIKDNNFKKLVQSVKDFPEMIEAREIVVNENMIILGGNMRYRALKEAGVKEVPVKIVNWSEDKQREFVIKDNISGGEWDWDILANQWDEAQLDDWGLEIPHVNMYDEGVVGSLEDKFIVPPFTVLDTRQGYWADRKRDWLGRMDEQGQSRENALGEGLMAGINKGVSILDPVLAEVLVHWFTPPKAKCYDPFAGDAVFGFVAASLEHEFTGIELRKAQADLNNKRLKDNNLPGMYICDTSANADKYITDESQDFIFTCPPYADLEVYSDDPADLSTMKHDEFFDVYKSIMQNCYNKLKPNRFMAVVVGEVRNKSGAYINLVPNTISMLTEAGFIYYNEAVLINAVGTAQIRANRSMNNRKLVKLHQNVLVFYKGDMRKIKENYPKIEVPEIELDDYES